MQVLSLKYDRICVDRDRPVGTESGRTGRYLCLNIDLGLVNVRLSLFGRWPDSMPSVQVPGRYAAPSIDPRDGEHWRGRNCSASAARRSRFPKCLF